jgi:hypothetical protein
MEEKLDTLEWCNKLGINWIYDVHDPDGWSRSNLSESVKEKITKETFVYRLSISTVDFGSEGIRKVFGL